MSAITSVMNLLLLILTKKSLRKPTRSGCLTGTKPLESQPSGLKTRQLWRIPMILKIQQSLHSEQQTEVVEEVVNADPPEVVVLVEGAEVVEEDN